MKASILLSVILAFCIGSANAALAAGEHPKDTLHVERFSLYQNGTSSGKSLAQHTFIKRYYTEDACTAAKNAYSGETVLNIGGTNMTVLTIAKCEALNHSIYD